MWVRSASAARASEPIFQKRFDVADDIWPQATAIVVTALELNQRDLPSNRHKRLPVRERNHLVSPAVEYEGRSVVLT